MLSRTANRITDRISLSAISYGLIALGVVLRLVRYGSRRSLWGDEAKLALNIVERSYAELFQVLDYDQVAPVGFLLVEKAIAQVLGASDTALRLFPLLAGVGALLLAYRLARQVLSPLAVPIALAFIALSDRLIYYSSELKPYALDVFATLAVLTYARFDPRTLTWGAARRVALIGAIAVWFSYPAVFALAGVGLVCVGPMLYEQARAVLDRTDRKPIPWRLTLAAILPWAVSFLLFYGVSVQGNTDNSTLLDSWASRRGFPATLPDLDWFFYALKRMFQKPLSFPQPLFNHLAMIAWIGGTAAFLRQGRPAAFGLLASPLLMSLIAAYLYKYPFYSRLILFLVPPMMMIIAEGIAAFMGRRGPLALSGVALAACLLYLPVTRSSSLWVNPIINEEIKPLMAHIQQHWQPGDVIYVFQKSKFQFQFYKSAYGYGPDDYVIGVDPEELGVEDLAEIRQLYRQDLRSLCGEERVWLLVSDIDIREDTIMVIEHLERMGQQTDRVEAGGLSSFVARYDLSACGDKTARVAAYLTVVPADGAQ